MKKYKIWKNTSLLDNFSKNLKFTEKKEDADIILLGSKKININEFKKLKGIFRAGVGQENIPFEACRKKNSD